MTDPKAGWRIGLVLLACSVAPSPAQVVLHVDAGNCPGPGSGSAADPFCEIQAGVDAAQAGDDVRVAAGTYPEHLDLLGKSILLRASEGPQVTTIDAGGTGSAISCTGSETTETVVQGFTLRNGPGTQSVHCTGQGPLDGVFGGGILVVNSAVTVRNCRFVDNGNDSQAEILGGGAIYVEDGAMPGNGSARPESSLRRFATLRAFDSPRFDPSIPGSPRNRA